MFVFSCYCQISLQQPAPWWLTLATILACYFIGGIPFGYLVGKINKIDIRTVGSGNIGATNVFRTLGKKWGIFVFVCDFFKGFFPTWTAATSVNLNGALPQGSFIILAAIATILGHTFTPFLKFKGGKGVATSAGVLLAMLPKAFGVTAIIWFIVFYTSGYVSLASIAASIVLPLSTLLFYRYDLWLVGFSFLIGVLVIVRHKSNIQRLLTGTESKSLKK